MELKARIIKKDSLEQMYNIRYDFNKGHKAGKMDWELIDIETVLENLDNDGVMVFTQRFGEVDGSDRAKIEALTK